MITVSAANQNHQAVWGLWACSKPFIQFDTGQLLGGNCFLVAKTLHWLDDLGCNRTVTSSILSIQLKHTGMASQQELSVTAKHGLDLIENMWND